MNCAVIGAGASGIVCAIKLKQLLPNAEVVLIEKEEIIGRKLLATGNGRCNLSNKNICYETTFAQNIFEKNDVSKTLEFFKSIGIETITDSENRIYPLSLQASSVVKIFENTIKKLHINLITSANVNNIIKDEHSRYTVFITSNNANKTLKNFDFIVIACGGQAQKNLGSNGSGYKLLKQFGHTSTDLLPSLVQLKSSSKHCRALKGVRRKCIVTAECNKKAIKSEYGEVLFTDYGLSGIVIMNLSEIFSKHAGEKNVVILDLVPTMTEEEIKEHLQKNGDLIGILGIKLSEIIEKQAEKDYEKMAKFCKSWRLIITGTLGFDHAQITCGGMKTSEFTKNAESKLSKNLFATGEILDVQGPCGGYNLQWAFSSALTVAEEIAGRTNDKNK